MKGGSAPTPEFSRIVDVSGIGQRTMTRDISATPAERAALAQRFGLHALARLNASVTLRGRGMRVVELEGRFEAELEQVCVVTLEPVEGRLARSFRQAYSPDLPAEGEGIAEIVIAADDEEDDPEPLIGGQIDIGEAVAQQLAVALDPYPRRPDAAIAQILPPELDAPGDRSAFAALAQLRKS